MLNDFIKISLVVRHMCRYAHHLTNWNEIKHIVVLCQNKDSVMIFEICSVFSHYVCFLLNCYLRVYDTLLENKLFPFPFPFSSYVRLSEINDTVLSHVTQVECTYITNRFL